MGEKIDHRTIKVPLTNIVENVAQ